MKGFFLLSVRVFDYVSCVRMELYLNIYEGFFFSLDKGINLIMFHVCA